MKIIASPSPPASFRCLPILCATLAHMPHGRVLIVDADPLFVRTAREALGVAGYEAIAESDALCGMEQVAASQPGVIVCNAHAPGIEGFELLRELRANYPEVPVVLVVDEGSIELALRAIQEEGAFHFFEKPIDPRSLIEVVNRAFQSRDGADDEPEDGVRPATGGGETPFAFGKLIGSSEPMRRVYALIEQVATSSASVLITGESGTGKEMVARTIHQLSPRRRAQFVAINCSAIPETLMESELFGHERGAFTGAATRRQGCFELAHGGTLLLDEIAEMPAFLQAKLLRVLEERTVRRLGGAHETPVDVRVLAATNRDPHDAVRAGVFREDLLYRLNVITIELPPLRLRKDDLPLLAQHMIKRLSARHERPARRISLAALDVLNIHHWPGNVRELRNVIERAVIICSGESIERHHVAPYPLDQRARARSEDTITLPVGTPLEEVERQMLLRTLHKTDNNKTRAAALLQISLKTLHNKLKSYRERGLLDELEGSRFSASAAASSGKARE